MKECEWNVVKINVPSKMLTYDAMESHVFIDKVGQLMKPQVGGRMEYQRQGVRNDNVLRVNLHRSV